MASTLPPFEMRRLSDRRDTLWVSEEVYLSEGEAVFAKFNPDADARWYYRQMRDVLAPKIPPTLLAEIDRNLETLGA